MLWGVGCRECGNSGFRGRTGLVELMIVNDEIGELVMKRASAVKISEAGKRNGLVPLREDGWAKVAAGLTTPEEVLRVTKA